MELGIHEEKNLHLRTGASCVVTKKEDSRILRQVLPQREHNHPDILRSDAQPPELGGHELLLSESHSRTYSRHL